MTRSANRNIYRGEVKKTGLFYLNLTSYYNRDRQLKIEEFLFAATMN